MKQKIILLLIIFFLSTTAYSQIPKYQDYNEIIIQLQSWHKKYENTEIYKYGQTKKDLVVFKIEGKEKEKKNILVFGCVHSNEPLATSMAMGYTGYLLFHRNDNNIKEIIESQDIYMIPVVCPDLFPNSRAYDGVDPNRNFDKQNSVVPIQQLKELGLKIKPKAVLSLHTFGRKYLMPWGRTNELCKDNEKYTQILNKMSQMSNYSIIRACQMYGRPIYGSELDWFYQRGSFTIVQECGTHQHIPTWNDIQYEFNRTFPAFLYFLKSAPEVEIK